MVKKSRRGLWRIPVILAILFIYLSPLYLLVCISFKSPTDLSSYWKFPSVVTLENFTAAIKDGGILEAMSHSLLITVVAVILIVMLGAFAAYPMARSNNRLSKFMKGFVLGIMMIPPLSILVPLYSTLVAMGGVNQYWGIFITLLTFELPLSIFLYSSFIVSIPKALDEAAKIDGCNPIKAFFYIILPQLKPVTASVIILTGVHCWNDYQFSLYILQAPSMRTITLAISSFFSQTTSNLNAAAAAALLAILPYVILFLFLQKYFIKGMVDSAIK